MGLGQMCRFNHVGNCQEVGRVGSRRLNITCLSIHKQFQLTHLKIIEHVQRPICIIDILPCPQILLWLVVLFVLNRLKCQVPWIASQVCVWQGVNSVFVFCLHSSLSCIVPLEYFFPSATFWDMLMVLVSRRPSHTQPLGSILVWIDCITGVLFHGNVQCACESVQSVNWFFLECLTNDTRTCFVGSNVGAVVGLLSSLQERSWAVCGRVLARLIRKPATRPGIIWSKHRTHSRRWGTKQRYALLSYDFQTVAQRRDRLD